MELRLNVTEEERRLLIELLQQEQRDLHPELRRTDTVRVRDDLLARLELVERMLSRLAQVSESVETG